MISRSIAGLASLILAVASATAAAAQPLQFGSPAAVAKGSDLRGRIVETRDGEELGRVQDFALDLNSGRIAYVVVSVGSFLIQDSLIAVAPDALRESADADGRLVLNADAASLRDAERFSQRGNWPLRADVVAAAGERQPERTQSAGDGESERPMRGTATISDGQRTATLSAGERSIRFESQPGDRSSEGDRANDKGVDRARGTGSGASSARRAAPTSHFERLDLNGDGVLNRAEIAHELTRDDSFSSIDRDGSGDVDPDEFAALLERRATAETQAPSR